MLITVKGGRQHQRADLETAAYFFAQRLMHPNLIRRLNINIAVVSKLNMLGVCDTTENDRGNYREFDITIRQTNDDRDIVQTLAHEMVHVKQYSTGELSATGILVSIAGRLIYTTQWNGKTWLPRNNECQYYDSPWEINAYGMEVGLYHKWSTRNDHKIEGKYNVNG